MLCWRWVRSTAYAYRIYYTQYTHTWDSGLSVGLYQSVNLTNRICFTQSYTQIISLVRWKECRTYAHSPLCMLRCAVQYSIMLQFTLMLLKFFSVLFGIKCKCTYGNFTFAVFSLLRVNITDYNLVCNMCLHDSQLDRTNKHTGKSKDFMRFWSLSR